MNQNDHLRATLAKIAEVASAAIEIGEDFENYEHKEGEESEQASQEDTPACVLKSLPKRLLVKAAETARTINPVNAPVFGPLASVAAGLEINEPLRLAVLTAKYWGPKPRTLTISFMESTPADLKTRIISHMNAWTKTGCISFVGTNGTGDIRISREPGGYWSYLGTDVLLIPKNRPTMNLQGFTMRTPESEYKRVVHHETGHTLGFPHEHMRKDLVARIDPAKAYKWFLETYGWDRATVDSQVLTPLDEASLMGTPADQTSIMCYQLPRVITKDGKPITGGTDINQTDYMFAGKIYPKPGYVTAAQEEDWAESEDVEVAV
ncbi:M12 family metallopeptidase [Methylocaldum sp.]|uniref:M12 family metallopeptidase n=1 Tax=Methylocaldum sp. TaxID=1969727 RepID=UPI002D30F01B|nr:M12 family metallopeptidase [Methylocaldum sp.]HYE33991.1 M12 family metallopeptidase [Methylocaldum sp.]